MKNFDELDKINQNPNQLYNSEDHYRILIIRGSGSGKTNVLLNLIKHQLDLDKIQLSVKDTYKSKDHLLIKKSGEAKTKHLQNPKAFIDYFQSIDDI